MDSTITLAPDNHQSKTTARRLPRPKVRFMRPQQLAPYKEQVWAINEAVFERTRVEFEATFDATSLYAVFFVGQEVVGLTTVMEHEFTLDGRRVFTIGLGRAAVRHDFRNQFLVQRALIFRWMRWFARHPLQPIYIWGSCVSYKSYLSFVKVLKVVYPVAQVPTPAKHARVIDAIGAHWYGDKYEAATKTVRVPNFKVSDSSVIPSNEDLTNPDIQFYVAAVPSERDATYGLLTISPCIRSNFLPMVTSWVRNLVRKSLGLRRKR